MKKTIYTALLICLSFTACSSDEDMIDGQEENKDIELFFRVDNFVKGTTKATNDGSTGEQTISDLYVFLFPVNESQTLEKHYISASSFTGGSWNPAEKKVSLELTQSEAGSRNVYVVANCSELKTALDGVGKVADLLTIFQSNTTPWSTILKTPILMSGNKTHNFNSNYQLSSVPLVRALAKVQLNITLSEVHQGLPLSSDNQAQYKYKFIGFDQKTYVLKQTSKVDAPVGFIDWAAWEATGSVASYATDTSGKIITLQLITYLNERSESGAAIEISIPYTNGGKLPPPEFGDETYKLLLPAEIQRNNWYVYDVEI